MFSLSVEVGDANARVDSGGPHPAVPALDADILVAQLDTGNSDGSHLAAMKGDVVDMNAGVDSGGPHPAVPALDSDILVAQFDTRNSDGSHLTAMKHHHPRP